MRYKNIDRFIIILLFGLLITTACLLANNSTRGAMRLAIRNECIHLEPIPIAPSKTNTTIRDSIVLFARNLLGTPYVSAGCSKNGFDCSGLVYFVFMHFNIQVPRTSSQFAQFGKDIPIENVKKGDILVFLSPTRNAIGHVGIVVNAKGKESDFIHASSGNEMKVMISSLKQEGYTRRFVKAVDVISNL